MTQVLLRIGEFARYLGISVRTVRYYSDIGLLAPTEVDPDTGYRAYGLDRLETGRRLLALKDLGLTLEEIRQVLDDELDDGAYRSLITAHVERLEHEQERGAERLDRAKAHLQSLTSRLEPAMADITITTTEPQTIAFIRDNLDGVAAIGAMFPRLFESVNPSQAIGTAGQAYHEFADDGSFIDFEAFVPVADDYEPSGEAQVRRLEAGQVATYTHHGAFERLPQAYDVMLRWISENGYQVSGPSYEWNIVCNLPVRQDDDSNVTEIQIEVTKAE